MAGSISVVEFANVLGRCLPRRANTVIAVANSAGPDSTCLLFLLRQLFHPTALLSLHVVHNLQPASHDMALVAADNAHLLDIPHHASQVPWGVPPFPPVPTVGPIERTARDARYHLLFRDITRAGVPLLALAHHADDQIETAILRLAHGSSLLGAAGMRSCRRWGMGSDTPLASFGHRGMNAFILRPLLPFPKHRILATCHAHHLHYINDPTNSQPHLTPRNAIRHCLHHHPAPLASTVPLSFHDIDNAASILRSIVPGTQNEKQCLYTALSDLAARVERINVKVTSYLTQHALPSPIGTLLLSMDQLLNVTDPDVRVALVLRIIRYVSFHPWGSLRADADRRMTSIHRIIDALWPPISQASRTGTFTARGGVLWSPAIFNPKRSKSLRVGNQCLHAVLEPDDALCWLVSRMPPFAKNPQRQGAGSPTKLVIDLTERLANAIVSDSPSDTLEILYDCRFLLRIDPLRMPTHVKSALKQLDRTVSVRILPFSQYYWPKLVLERESHPDQLLAVLRENGTVDAAGSLSWVSIQWIRPLDYT